MAQADPQGLEKILQALLQQGQQIPGQAAPLPGTGPATSPQPAYPPSGIAFPWMQGLIPDQTKAQL